MDSFYIIRNGILKNSRYFYVTIYCSARVRKTMLFVKTCIYSSSVSNSLQSRDCSLPGSSVHGISQARVLEWVAFPSPGDLSDPGNEPRSHALQADALPSEPPGKPKFGIKSSEKKVNMLWCMCAVCLTINKENFTTKVQGNVVTAKSKFRIMFKLMVNSKYSKRQKLGEQMCFLLPSV